MMSTESRNKRDDVFLTLSGVSENQSTELTIIPPRDIMFEKFNGLCYLEIDYLFIDRWDFLPTTVDLPGLFLFSNLSKPYAQTTVKSFPQIDKKLAFIPGEDFQRNITVQNTDGSFVLESIQDKLHYNWNHDFFPRSIVSYSGEPIHMFFGSFSGQQYSIQQAGFDSPTSRFGIEIKLTPLDQSKFHM